MDGILPASLEPWLIRVGGEWRPVKGRGTT